jgi:hypothetical protein
MTSAFSLSPSATSITDLVNPCNWSLSRDNARLIAFKSKKDFFTAPSQA